MGNQLPAKVKKAAQRAGGGGWNKHVDKRMKRAANRKIRQWKVKGQ